ncbi:MULTISPECIES: HepT-like ribonuclease domain-containing protein [Rothia]|uniref:DUF86 domain-containing protein n=2 Tax=Rothia TaxID=32207 RepID=A0A1Y1RRM8_9MICC|nr:MULTISPECIES: HepT-like ribonuclease domain-containing protein [Rothia]ORC22062.1 hypothetical protein A7979_00665 [Rothia nasimurium]
MSRPIELRLMDIQEAIDSCFRYQKYLEVSDTQEMALDAILRNLAIIGEAVNHLPKALKDQAPEVEWRAIVGLRNFLVHQYFSVSAEEIQDILNEDLKSLRATVENFINIGGRVEPDGARFLRELSMQEDITHDDENLSLDKPAE